jgi:hypothetical protein
MNGFPNLGIYDSNLEHEVNQSSRFLFPSSTYNITHYCINYYDDTFYVIDESSGFIKGISRFNNSRETIIGSSSSPSIFDVIYLSNTANGSDGNTYEFCLNKMALNPIDNIAYLIGYCSTTQKYVLLINDFNTGTNVSATNQNITILNSTGNTTPPNLNLQEFYGIILNDNNLSLDFEKTGVCFDQINNIIYASVGGKIYTINNLFNKEIIGDILLDEYVEEVQSSINQIAIATYDKQIHKIYDLRIDYITPYNFTYYNNMNNTNLITNNTINCPELKKEYSIHDNFNSLAPYHVKLSEEFIDKVKLESSLNEGSNIDITLEYDNVYANNSINTNSTSHISLSSDNVSAINNNIDLLEEAYFTVKNICIFPEETSSYQPMIYAWENTNIIRNSIWNKDNLFSNIYPVYNSLSLDNNMAKYNTTFSDTLHKPYMAIVLGNDKTVNLDYYSEYLLTSHHHSNYNNTTAIATNRINYETNAITDNYATESQLRDIKSRFELQISNVSKDKSQLGVIVNSTNIFPGNEIVVPSGASGNYPITINLRNNIYNSILINSIRFANTEISVDSNPIEGGSNFTYSISFNDANGNDNIQFLEIEYTVIGMNNILPRPINFHERFNQTQLYIDYYIFKPLDLTYNRTAEILSKKLIKFPVTYLPVSNTESVVNNITQKTNNGFSVSFNVEATDYTINNRKCALYIRKYSDNFLDFFSKYYETPNISESRFVFPRNKPENHQTDNWHLCNIENLDSEKILSAGNLDPKTKYIAYIAELQEANGYFIICSKKRITFTTEDNDIKINELEKQVGNSFIELFNTTNIKSLNNLYLGYVDPSSLNSNNFFASSPIELGAMNFINNYLLIAKNDFNNPDIINYEINNNIADLFTNSEKIIILFTGNGNPGIINKSQIIDAVVYLDETSTSNNNYHYIGLNSDNFPEYEVEKGLSIQRKSDGYGLVNSAASFHVNKSSPNLPNGLYPELEGYFTEIPPEKEYYLSWDNLNYRRNYADNNDLSNIKITLSNDGLGVLKNTNTNTTIINPTEVAVSDFENNYIEYTPFNDELGSIDIEVKDGFYTSTGKITLPVNSSFLPFVNFTLDGDIYHDEGDYGDETIYKLSINLSKEHSKEITVSFKLEFKENSTVWSKDFSHGDNFLRAISKPELGYDIFTSKIPPLTKSVTIDIIFIGDKEKENNETFKIKIENVEDIDGEKIPFMTGESKITVIDDDYLPEVIGDKAVYVHRYQNADDIIYTFNYTDKDEDPSNLNDDWSIESDLGNFFDINKKGELSLKASNIGNFNKSLDGEVKVSIRDKDNNLSEIYKLFFNFKEPYTIKQETVDISDNTNNNQVIEELIVLNDKNQELYGGKWEILTGLNADKFDIDPTTGVISTTNDANIQNNTEYKISVRYTDGDNGAGPKEITFSTLNSNNVPIISQNQTGEIADNYIPNRRIIYVKLDNFDSNETYSWSISNINTSPLTSYFNIDNFGGIFLNKAIPVEYQNTGVEIYVECSSSAYNSAPEKIYIDIIERFEINTNKISISKYIESNKHIGDILVNTIDANSSFDIISSTLNKNIFSISDNGSLLINDNTDIVNNAGSIFSEYINVQYGNDVNKSEIKTIEISISDKIPYIYKGQNFVVCESVQNVELGEIIVDYDTNFNNSWTVISYRINDGDISDSKFEVNNNKLRINSPITYNASGSLYSIKLKVENNGIESNPEIVQLHIIETLDLSTNSIDIPLGLSEDDTIIELTADMPDGSKVEDLDWQIDPSSNHKDLFEISNDGEVKLKSGATLDSDQDYTIKIIGSKNNFTTGSKEFTISTDSGTEIPLISEIPNNLIKIGEKLIFNAVGHFGDGFYTFDASNLGSSFKWELLETKNKNGDIIDPNNNFFELALSGELFLNKPIDYDINNDIFNLKVQVSTVKTDIIKSIPKIISVQIIEQPIITDVNIEIPQELYTDAIEINPSNPLILTKLAAEYDDPKVKFNSTNWLIVNYNGNDEFFKLEEETGNLFLIKELGFNTMAIRSIDIVTFNKLHKSFVKTIDIKTNEASIPYINPNQTYRVKEKISTVQNLGEILGNNLTNPIFEIVGYTVPQNIEDSKKPFIIDNTSRILESNLPIDKSEFSNFEIFVQVSDNGKSSPIEKLKINVIPSPYIINTNVSITEGLSGDVYIEKLIAEFNDKSIFDGVWSKEIGGQGESNFDISSQGFLLIKDATNVPNGTYKINVKCINDNPNDNIPDSYTEITEITISKQNSFDIPIIEEQTLNIEVGENFVPFVPITKLELENENNANTYNWEITDLLNSEILDKLSIDNQGQINILEPISISDFSNNITIYARVSDITSGFKSNFTEINIKLLTQPSINEETISISTHSLNGTIIEQLSLNDNNVYSIQPSWTWVEKNTNDMLNIDKGGAIILIDNTNISTPNLESYSTVIKTQAISKFNVSEVKTITINADWNIPFINTGQIFYVGESVSNVTIGSISGKFQNSTDLTGLKWNLVDYISNEGNPIITNLFNIDAQGNIILNQELIFSNEDSYYNLNVQLTDNTDTYTSKTESIKVQVVEKPIIYTDKITILRSIDNGTELDIQLDITPPSIPNASSILWTYQKSASSTGTIFNVTNDGKIIVNDNTEIKDIANSSFTITVYGKSDKFITDDTDIIIKIIDDQYIPEIDPNQIFELGNNYKPTGPLGILSVSKLATNFYYELISAVDNNGNDYKSSFNIDIFSGQITFNQSVDILTISDFTLEAAVTNIIDGFEYKSDVGTFKIVVFEKPIIQETEIEIPQGEYIGMNIGKLTAKYKTPKVDFIGNWKLISNSDKISIEEKTGNLILLGTFELKGTFSLDFQTSNSAHQSEIKTINFTTESEDIPVILPDQVFEIAEKAYLELDPTIPTTNIEIDVILGTNISDCTWDIQLSSINGETTDPAHYLSIKNNTDGKPSLYLDKQLESPDYKDIIVNVKATNNITNKSSNTVEIKLHIAVVPKIQDQIFYVPASENLINTVIGLIEFDDIDSSRDELIWTVTDGNTSALDVDKTSGRLLNYSNDFSITQEIKIYATDQSSLKSSIATISVIEDVNTAPYFKDNFELISETNKISEEEVTTIQAYINENKANLTEYEILPVNYGGKLDNISISNNGTITINEMLDYETVPFYEFYFQAKNESDDVKSVYHLFSINLINIEDEIPIVIPTTLYIEEKAIGLPVNRSKNNITAYDPDGYDIKAIYIEKDNPYFGKFYFDNNGYLYPHGIDLDKESISSFTLEVYAEDEFGNYSETQTINVMVEDLNDNPAYIVDNNYEFSISEKSENNDDVGEIIIADDDSEIKYDNINIIDGNDLGAFKFVGNKIQVANRYLLNFERKNEFVLKTAVFSNGVNSSPVNVKINITKYSQAIKNPIIYKSQSFPLSEAAEIGLFVGNVRFDTELGFTDFNIISGNDQNIFEVDLLGNLYVLDNTHFDAIYIPSYTLNLQADCGNGNKSSRTEVIINMEEHIMDEIILQITPSTVFLDEANGSETNKNKIIAKLKLLQGKYRKITQSDYLDKFAIDVDGNIKCLQDLDAETQNIYHLTYSASYGSNYSKPTPLTVYVNNVDDNDPILPDLGRIYISGDTTIFLPVIIPDMDESKYILELESIYPNISLNTEEKIDGTVESSLTIDNAFTGNTTVRYSIKKEGGNKIFQDLEIYKRVPPTDPEYNIEDAVIFVSEYLNSTDPFAKLDIPSGIDIDLIITKGNYNNILNLNKNGDFSLTSKGLQLYKTGDVFKDKIYLQVAVKKADNTIDKFINVTLDFNLKYRPSINPSTIYIPSSISNNDYIGTIFIDKTGLESYIYKIVGFDDTYNCINIDNSEIKDKYELTISNNLNQLITNKKTTLNITLKEDDLNIEFNYIINIVVSEKTPVIDVYTLHNINESNTDITTNISINLISGDADLWEIESVDESDLSNNEKDISDLVTITSSRNVMFKIPPDFENPLFSSVNKFKLTAVKLETDGAKTIYIRSIPKIITINLRPINDEAPEIISSKDIVLSENIETGFSIDNFIEAFDKDIDIDTNIKFSIIPYLTELPDGNIGVDLASRMFNIAVQRFGVARLELTNNFLLDKELYSDGYKLNLRVEISDGSINSTTDFPIQIIDVDEFPLRYSIIGNSTEFIFPEYYDIKEEEKIIIEFIDLDYTKHSKYSYIIEESTLDISELFYLKKYSGTELTDGDYYVLDIQPDKVIDFNKEIYGDEFMFKLSFSSDISILKGESKWIKIKFNDTEDKPLKAIIDNITEGDKFYSFQALYFDASNSLSGSSGKISSYNWIYPNNFTEIDNGQDEIIKLIAPAVNETTSFDIKLRITNTSGNSSEDSYNITIEKLEEDENQDLPGDINIVPNPTYESKISYNIIDDTTDPILIIVATLNGTIKYQGLTNEKNGVINLNLEEGVYLLTYYSSSNNYKPVTKKIYRYNK